MPQSIGDRIRQIRGGLGVGEFAERRGVNRKTVARWESNEALPDGASLLTLHSCFGADPGWILTGGGAQPSPAELAPDERILLDNYRHSPPDAQAALKATSDAFARRTGKKAG